MNEIKRREEVQEEMEQFFVFWKLFMDHLGRFLDKKKLHK